MKKSLLICAGAAAVLIGAASPAAARVESRQLARAEARLETAFVEALRADGPFFTAEERALVEQACGYPAGSWNGYEFSMDDGVLHCTNGRDVDSPAVRAMMDAAAPRIGRRVAAAAAHPDVRSALTSVNRAMREDAIRERTQLDLMFGAPGGQNFPPPPREAPPQPSPR